MGDVSDIRLIEQARHCSDEAFGQLVNRYEPRLRAYIRANGVPGVDDEDVAQKVWLEVWQAIHKPAEDGGYDPARAGFYTWVIKCFARYRVLDQIESRRRSHQTIGTTEDGNPLDAIPAAQSDVTPEDAIRLRLEAFIQLFRLLWHCGGYPHEQIAFVLSKLVRGVESQRGMEGVPQHADQEYGCRWLDTLIDESWAAYMSASGMDPAALAGSLQTCLEPARIRLLSPVGRLIQPLQESMRSLQDKKTGQTCFRDYYATEREPRQSKGTHPISQWCWRVLQRIRHLLGLPSDVKMTENEMDDTIVPIAHISSQWPMDKRHCSHCKLRFVPPCCPKEA
jgi:DNA-directed RNA polymerase specialized sigma24 family protein